jgi:uncharacterized protein (TIGR02611 family)
MGNAPHLPTASSLAEAPHSVGRPWTDTNRTARFCEGPPVRQHGERKKVMQDEDFKFSGQNLTLTKAMQRTKRLLKIVLGFTLLVMGAAMLVLPGPGWLTIGLGLMALAAEFIWARRLLNLLKEQAIKLGRFVSGGTDPK